MKRLMYFLALSVLALVVVAPTMFAAIDTVYVPPTPAGNLNNVVNGDTLAGGVRAHPDRVYKLRRGTVYQVTQPMKINGSIIVIANDTTGNVRPPVLAPAILADNSSIDHYFEFLGRGGKASLSHLYLLSFRADQAPLGWSDAIRIYADSVTLKMRGCVLDGFSSAGIVTSAQWTKEDIQDCVFRNHMHPGGAWFGGQPIMAGSPLACDTVKIINNTFFANNSYLFSIRGYDVHSVFNHNTLVYGTVNPFLTRQAVNIYIKNNLFYAMHAMGGNPAHVIGSWFLNWPDTTASGILMHRWHEDYNAIPASQITGPEVYVDSAHGVTAGMLDPAKRVIQVNNNDYWFPSKLTSFYTAYNDSTTLFDSVDLNNGTKAWMKRTLIPAKFATNYLNYAVAHYASAKTNIGGTLNLDPGFTDVNVNKHIDTLIAFVNRISTGTLTSDPWYFRPSALYPPVWPLPENLAYTNASLQTAGTDGYAIGDLNWFPSQKAAFLAANLTSVQPASTVPGEFQLSQNFPNPFNPTTQISYTLPVNTQMTLQVFNALGQLVKTLENGQMAAGKYTATWNGTNEAGSVVASGMYFYRLSTPSFTSTMKMLLLK
jgi:hypothetical protein